MGDYDEVEEDEDMYEDEDDHDVMEDMEEPPEEVPQRGLWAFVKRVWRMLARPTLGLVGRLAARAFVESYERLLVKHDVTSRPPPFFADSYRQAVASAMDQQKLLLIYLHSPMHQDCVEFMREVLNAGDFERFTRSRFVLWGADVSGADGHAMAGALRAERFPFLVVVVCRPDGEEIVDRIQGNEGVGAVITRLERVIESRREQLAPGPGSTSLQCSFNVPSRPWVRRTHVAQTVPRTQGERRPSERRDDPQRGPSLEPLNHPSRGHHPPE